MSTENAIAFRENLEGLTIPPIGPALPHITSVFQHAVTGPAANTNTLEVKADTAPVMDNTSKMILSNTVMAGGMNMELPKTTKTSQSDVATLGKGVAGTALDVGIALFDALGSKPEPEDLAPKGLALNNMAPRPPTVGGLF